MRHTARPRDDRAGERDVHTLQGFTSGRGTLAPSGSEFKKIYKIKKAKQLLLRSNLHGFILIAGWQRIALL